VGLSWSDSFFICHADALIASPLVASKSRYFRSFPAIHPTYLLHGVLLTDGMSMDKLPDLLAKMLGQHLLVDAVIATLQHILQALQSFSWALAPSIPAPVARFSHTMP